MEGLAKSAPVESISINVEPINQEASHNVPIWQGIPMDIFKFMNVDFFEASDKHQEELRDIYEYVKQKSNGQPGDIIQKIEELQNRLGEPSIGTSRLAQLSNYVRINKNISDMMKQKRAMERNYA